MTTNDDHAPSAARRKRLKEMEADSSISKQLLNVLDSYPIDKYYAMADRLVTAFQVALDERRLDDAYVFGLRFATFSIEGLPKHGHYQRNKMERAKNKRQVDQVLQRLELVATRMDAEEKLLARKRQLVQEAKRRQEEARKQEEERKKQDLLHAGISKEQQYAAILRQQRDELLQQQKSERVVEERPKKELTKQEIEKRAHEKLRLLNTKSKPQQQQQQQSNVQPTQSKTQKKENKSAPQQSTVPTHNNSKTKLVQASVDGNRTEPASSTSNDPVSFPPVPTAKPKLQKAPSKQKTNNNKQEEKSKINSAKGGATKDTKTSSETFQANVFSSEQPKKESSKALASDGRGGSTTVSTGQEASSTVTTGDEVKAPSKSWWDTSASADQNSQKPWWQRDATSNDAAATSTAVSADSDDAAVVPTKNGIAVTTGNEADNKESAPVSKSNPAPQKSSKLTLFQKLSPKKSSNNKKIKPSHQEPASEPSSKNLSSEGYEITMGSTSNLQVVETEPEEDEEEPCSEEAYRAKLTPAEAKTIRLLEDTIKLQESRLARMEASKDRSILRQEAKRKLQQGDRKGALYCLAKKKRINHVIDVTKNAIFNMETQIMMLESAVESREVGSIMKEASDAMNSLQNGVRVSDFTDERMGDVLASVGQGGMDMDYDEEELLSELREPSEKDLSDLADDSGLLSLPTAPKTEVEQDDALSKQEMSVSRIVASLF